MSYKIEFSPDIVKTLRKMDSGERKQILNYVRDVLSGLEKIRELWEKLLRVNVEDFGDIARDIIELFAKLKTRNYSLLF